VTRHLALADVLALHAYMMRATGWQPAPLRGGGEELLESAAMRPSMAEHHAGADLLRQAAVLALGISQAGAFVHGNKRTAYIAGLTFLRANGRRIKLDNDGLALARELERVSERTDSLEAATDRFEAWLRAQPTE
jgi:death-on-curing protein